MIIYKRMILILLTCITLTAQAQEKRHFLGALEEINYITSTNNYNNDRIVRILFEKKGNEWISLWGNLIGTEAEEEGLNREILAENISAEIHWTIAFDGKKLAEVTSKKVTPKVDDYKTKFNYYPASQEIINKASIPTIGKRSLKYASSMDDKPIYRPLVVNSMPYYKDPDGWKPAKLSAEEINLLRQTFRKKFPKVKNCPAKNNDQKPWLYKDKDINIRKSYLSNKNWFIAELSLEDRCDEPFGGPAFDGVWFAISSDHKIKFLREDMWLVDAGDYDNSGSSQLVFALNGYNRYGYALFYANFTKHVEVEGSFN